MLHSSNADIYEAFGPEDVEDFMNDQTSFWALLFYSSKAKAHENDNLEQVQTLFDKPKYEEYGGKQTLIDLLTQITFSLKDMQNMSGVELGASLISIWFISFSQF